MQIRTNRTRRTGRPDRDAALFSDHSKRSQSRSSRPQANTNSNGVVNVKRSYERYVTLARAAASTGDSVEVENLYQHAEHYFRLMRKQAA